MRPAIARITPSDGEPARRLPVPQPEPADDEDGREVLEQQRHPDGEVAHRVEVGELTTRDPGEAVADDEARTATQHSPPAAEHPEGGQEKDDRCNGDAERDDRAGRPTPDEQRLGESP